MQPAPVRETLIAIALMMGATLALLAVCRALGASAYALGVH